MLVVAIVAAVYLAQRHRRLRRHELRARGGTASVAVENVEAEEDSAESAGAKNDGS